MLDVNSSTRLQVLVVDDDPDFKANLQDILELDSHLVQLATSVLEVACREDLTIFDVILLDRQLLDGTGAVLLQYLRQTAPDAAVIVVTDCADFEMEVAGQGTQEFFLKPIEAEVLRSRLRAISCQHRIRKELDEAEQLA